MKEDWISTVLYIVIALAGVIGSAYQNQQKKKRAEAGPKSRPAPRDILAEPPRGFDLGPLMEVFDIPARPPVPVAEPETVESGPSVEEGGMLVDTREAAAEMDGLRMTETAKPLDTVPEPASLEEGQSDLRKLAARYEALNRQYNQEVEEESISADEIVSHEETLKREAQIAERKRFFNPRKAIIYSEILKRKEY
jgi:hypothetical protein